MKITILKTFHYSLYAILLSSIGLHLLPVPYSLESNTLNWVCWLFFCSGILIFWFSIITKIAVSKYYRLFFILPILAFVLNVTSPTSWVFEIVIFPLTKRDTIGTQNNIRISSGNNFMGPCCRYNIYETKFFVIDRKLASVRLEGEIDFNTIQIINTDSTAKVELSYVHIHDKALVRDTMLFIVKNKNIPLSLPFNIF
jgi:hypothetical protein